MSFLWDVGSGRGLAKVRNTDRSALQPHLGMQVSDFVWICCRLQFSGGSLLRLPSLSMPS